MSKPTEVLKSIFGDDSSSSDDEDESPEALTFTEAAAPAPAPAAAVVVVSGPGATAQSKDGSSSSDSSDSSDDSSDDDDAPKKRRSRLRKGGASAGDKRKVGALGSGDEYDSSSSDSSNSEDESFIDKKGDDSQLVSDYKKQKVFKDERPADYKTPEQEAQEELERKDPLAAALKRMAGSRERSKALSAEELGDTVVRFLQSMDAAHQQDTDARAAGLPGVAKVRLLPQVANILRREHWHRELLERDLLSALKRWLERGEDGTLPGLTIRTELYQLLDLLPVEMDHLKRSGIGNVLMTLFKSPHETTENKLMLQQIIEKWARPVFKRTVDYRSVVQDTYDDAPVRRRRREAPAEAVDLGKRKRDNGPQESFVRVPQPINLNYRIRPKKKQLSEKSTKLESDSVKGKLTKKMVNLRRPAQKNKRAESMSVEGRR